MVKEISSDELKRKLDEGEDVQVVDIRNPPSFAQGHIPGSDNVPFAKLTMEIDGYEWRDDVVVVCPIGESSKQAARLIESYEGFDGEAASLEGGVTEWEYDLERD
ncbi:MAG: rhodanese-like domain-containing protein [Halobacteriales archaeon]